MLIYRAKAKAAWAIKRMEIAREQAMNSLFKKEQTLGELNQNHEDGRSIRMILGTNVGSFSMILGSLIG